MDDSEKEHSLVPVVEPPAQRAEEISGDDPAAPKIGRWYWVDGDDEDEKRRPWFGCVVHVGTNYVEMKGPKHIARIHFDEFLARCKHEPDPKKVIGQKVAEYQGKIHALMDKVRDVTARLAIAPGPALTDGNETQALAVRGATQDMDAYKKALVKAKEKTLPELFGEIKTTNENLAIWLSAEVIPMQAEAEAMEPAISAIKDRIFSVELYAGLTEEVEQIREGEPAGLTEKLRLMQRRAYMDEECLVHYTAGGMEFKNLRAFEKWLTRAEHFNRIFPFPRCIVAFQVRRERKERELVNLRDFIRIMEEEQTDKFTFLYIRNGEQLFRLRTALEFDAKLFPDMDHNILGGKLYANVWASGSVHNIITENEYLARLAQDEERKKEMEKEGRQWHDFYSTVRDYHPFSRDSVYYDDIAEHIKGEMEKHNRLVLILQGLLDRSPVLHPHPPWQLWTNEGFTQALELVYDDTRALPAGEKPDFEAYRAKLNALITTGTVTVGQELMWEMHEAEIESARLDKDWRVRSDYRPTRFRPYGNPGPGGLAHVAKKSGNKCTYEWTRERQSRTDGPAEIACRFTTEVKFLFNVDAYKPGDFHIFYDDPRTRAEYLRWAPFLLIAEDYHAGKRKARPQKKMPPRHKTEEGSIQYERRKRRLAVRNKAVRLLYDLETKSGKKHPKGGLYRAIHSRGDNFDLYGIEPDGTRSKPDRHIYQVSLHEFQVDPTVPDDPKKETE
jgi:hypothetical protein